jgi:hypothetical protein
MFRNKILILVLMVVLLSMPIAFAVSQFTDVTSDFWGSDYITTVTEKNYIEGYDDGYFYPNREVTKLESLIALYRVMKENELTNISNVSALVESHKNTIESVGIPPMLAPYGSQDVYPAVAYALENEIITPSELKYFIEAGELTSVNKLEVSVYVGKALNLVKNENLFNDIISLEFKDQFEISNAAIPYVDLLIRNEIINKKGDSEGRFNPKQTINRAVLSVFISKLDLAVNSGENSNTGENNNESTSELTGEITHVHAAMNLIEIEDSSGASEVYDISDAKIFINGSEMSSSELKSGQMVNFEAKGDIIISLDVIETYDQLKGTITQISKEFSTATENYRVLAIKDVNGDSHYYKVTDATRVTVDSSESDILNLSIGDKVSVGYDDLYAMTVKGFSENEILTGVLIRPIGTDKMVRVELSNGETITGIAETVDPNVSRGEIVKLHLNYGDIVKVESTGKSSVVVGTIKEIKISEDSSLGLLKNDGKIIHYNILDTTEMIDRDTDESLTIYDLRLDKLAELKVNGLGIVELSVTKPAETIRFKGEVTTVYESLDLIEVAKDSGENIKVGFNTESNFKARDLKAGDQIIVSGIQLNDELFEARNIIIE